MVKRNNDKKRILVIEDEPVICRVCKKALTADGFEVDIAVNGLIAMDMAGKRVYDLYLSDIRTPEMNGIEFYRHLIQEQPELADRVIFTTGDVLSNDIKLFLEESGLALQPASADGVAEEETPSIAAQDDPQAAPQSAPGRFEPWTIAPSGRAAAESEGVPAEPAEAPDLAVTARPDRLVASLPDPYDYTDEEIAHYVASGDPLDKAGAYAIQHPVFDPVSRVEGCWLSVMGLPLCHLLRSLLALGHASDDLLAQVPPACQTHLDYDCPVTAEVLNSAPGGHHHTSGL